MTTSSAIRFSSKVRNLVKAKQQRATLALQKGDWLALELAPQALAGSRHSYAEYFPRPSGYGSARPYWPDLNSPEALAHSEAEDAVLAEIDKKWADFCAFIDTIPLPDPPPRADLSDEKEMVRQAREADSESDTLIALECWVESQAERLAERVRRTVERSYLQSVLDEFDRRIAEYLGIEPRKSELLPMTNGKAWLRELGARD